MTKYEKIAANRQKLWIKTFITLLQRGNSIIYASDSAEIAIEKFDKKFKSI